MAKGQVIEVVDDANQRVGMAGASVQPSDAAMPSSYGTVGEREVLMPHSTSNGLSYSQKRFRRVAAVFAGIVIIVKIMMLLSSAGSHSRKHAGASSPSVSPSVWHAAAPAHAATPNHMRPGFAHASIPRPGDVFFH